MKVTKWAMSSKLEIIPDSLASQARIFYGLCTVLSHEQIFQGSEFMCIQAIVAELLWLLKLFVHKRLP